MLLSFFLFAVVHLQQSMKLIMFYINSIFQMQKPLQSYQRELSDVLKQIISRNRQIQCYFLQHLPEGSCYWPLAQTLLLSAIRNQQKPTQQKSPQARYNVAYVKHNRFLSPSQKRAVTPKVTEVIPISSAKQIIYGKPKIFLDDEVGCPEHQNDCFQAENEEVQLQHSPKNQQPIYGWAEQQPPLPKKSKKQNDIGVETEPKYLSPTSTKPKSNQNYLKSPKNTNGKKFRQNKKTQISTDYFNYDFNQKLVKREEQEQRNERAEVLRRQRSKQQFASPRHITEADSTASLKLKNVESKIKYLIDKDKRNRAIQDRLQEQNREIKELEKRQKALLKNQLKAEQEQQVNAPINVKVTPNMKVPSSRRKKVERPTFSKNSKRNNQQAIRSSSVSSVDSSILRKYRQASSANRSDRKQGGTPACKQCEIEKKLYLDCQEISSESVGSSSSEQFQCHCPHKYLPARFLEMNEEN